MTFRNLWFTVLALASTPLFGQNVIIVEQELIFSAVKGTDTKPILLPLNIDATVLFSTKEQKYNYRLLLVLKNVPTAIATTLKLANVDPASIQPVGVPAPKTLKFELGLNLNADFLNKGDVLERTVSWSDTSLRPLQLRLPLAQSGATSNDNKAFRIDFCPEVDKPVQTPKGKNWLYVWPNQPVRMVIKHVNPLKYNVALESSGVALNTDPGAALSAVSGILNPGNKLFPSSKRSESRADPNVAKLQRLASIASAIEKQLNELKWLECLSEGTISQLKSSRKFYKDLLADTPDEFSLKAELNHLATTVSSLTTGAVSTTSSIASTTTNAGSSVSATTKITSVSSVAGNTTAKTSSTDNLTTTVSSLTTSNALSYSTSADADAIDSYKQFLRSLVDYARNDQLAHRTFEQLDKLDEVMDGATVRLRPVLPSNYSSADIIRLTLTTSPRSNTAATPIKQIYDVFVVGRFKVDFSAGLVATGLVDQVYSGRDTTFRRITTTANKPDTSDITRSLPVYERRDKITLALATMAHFYWRLPILNGGLNIGATVGGGITQKGRPIGLAGFSLLLGRAQRWVISSGWVIGTQKELAVRYDRTANYLNSQASNDFTYIDRTIVDGFVSLTFNWGKNERVVGSDGVTK